MSCAVSPSWPNTPSTLDGEARSRARRQARGAVRACWRGGTSTAGGAIGTMSLAIKDLYLEPQPWALISEVLDKEQQAILVEEITRRLADPLGSRISVRVGKATHRQRSAASGFPSTPLWYGVCPKSPRSAPGGSCWRIRSSTTPEPTLRYGSVSGLVPTAISPPIRTVPAKHGSCRIISVSQPWPVQILFPHSETLNSTLWMMGIEATAEGISVRPKLPFDCWSWSGSGLSISYDKARIHGSISGVGPELISLELQLPSDWQGAAAEIDEGGRKRKVARVECRCGCACWSGPVPLRNSK